MAFPTSGLVNNLVHKEGNRSFVYDSATGVWDRVREADTSNLDIQSGNIGPSVTGGAGLVTTPLSHRNMIINGAMQIDQRKEGVLFTGSGALDDRYHTVDRWREVLNIGDGRLSYQRVAITDLAGFGNALKIDCTTTGGTPSSGEYIQMHQRIEGLNLQQMEKGYPSAKPVTVSFWVKGTARTYVLELRDSVSPSRTASYQFSVTTSWVKHTATFPGDTDTDSKIPNDKTVGLNVIFWLAAGSNYTSGTYTATTWADWVAANACSGLGANSGKGIMETTDDELYITGLQLELGSTATPFEHRSYGDELLRCQRYYYAHTDGGNDRLIGKAGFNSSTQLEGTVHFKNTMRAVPTLKSGNGGGTNFYRAHTGGGVIDFNTLTIHAANLRDDGGCTATSVYKGGLSGTIGRSANMVTLHADAYVHFDSEL